MSKPRTFSYVVTGALVPPARLGITIHREAGVSFARDAEPYASFVASAIVDPDDTARRISGGGECRLGTGSWFQYEIPFRLQVTAFSFGFSDCSAKCFKDWTFEAFDGEEWRELYYSMDSPWIHDAAHRIPGSSSTCGNYRRKVFILSGAADFASTRFRIRLVESDVDQRCMHVRGLEIFGTILPPWRL